MVAECGHLTARRRPLDLARDRQVATKVTARDDVGEASRHYSATTRPLLGHHSATAGTCAGETGARMWSRRQATGSGRSRFSWTLGASRAERADQAEVRAAAEAERADQEHRLALQERRRAHEAQAQARAAQADATRERDRADALTRDAEALKGQLARTEYALAQRPSGWFSKAGYAAGGALLGSVVTHGRQKKRSSEPAP